MCSNNCDMEKRLRRLQLTELEILKTVHAFCVQHGIRYSLYAGTLLGAVRHKGFIPWDDDIDICMARSEYDRFIALWEMEGPAGFILQNKENSSGVAFSFTKIRKDHTAFVETAWEIGRYHNGIFIDIFPLDRVPSSWFAKKLFYLRCMIYQLMIREYTPPRGNPAIRLASSIILSMIPADKRKSVAKNMLKGLTKYNDNPALSLVSIATTHGVKVEYASTSFCNFVDLEFEGTVFPAFSNWDMGLHAYFGDYMKMPPVNERVWTHHPLCISFSQNISELQNITLHNFQ